MDHILPALLAIRDVRHIATLLECRYLLNHPFARAVAPYGNVLDVFVVREENATYLVPNGLTGVFVLQKRKPRAVNEFGVTFRKVEGGLEGCVFSVKVPERNTGFVNYDNLRAEFGKLMRDHFPGVWSEGTLRGFDMKDYLVFYSEVFQTKITEMGAVEPAVVVRAPVPEAPVVVPVAWPVTVKCESKRVKVEEVMPIESNTDDDLAEFLDFFMSDEAGTDAELGTEAEGQHNDDFLCDFDPNLIN